MPLLLEIHLFGTRFHDNRRKGRFFDDFLGKSLYIPIGRPNDPAFLKARPVPNQDKGRFGFQVSIWFTPPKFNMEPENQPLEKEIPFGNHHFQVPCLFSGVYMFFVCFLKLSLALGWDRNFWVSRWKPYKESGFLRHGWLFVWFLWLKHLLQFLLFRGLFGSLRFTNTWDCSNYECISVLFCKVWPQY